MKVKLANRVVDYFVVVSIGDSLSLASSKGERADKKKTLNLTYKPQIIDRFPLKDHEDCEFPRDLQMFCFPKGCNLTLAPQSAEIFHFILTEADGTRIFGTNFVFYEVLEPEISAQVSISTEEDDEDDTKTERTASNTKIFCPKCLCVTSHWPFYAQFETFFKLLYKTIATKSMNFPIERLIANFIFEIPLPPPGRIRVEWKSLGPSILFQRPPPNKKPQCEFDMSILFRCLSVNNIFLVFSAICCEKRILFVSDHFSKLTACTELLTWLTCPLYWRHIYIPVLPQKLTDFVCAPMPFVVGVNSAYLPDELMLDRVIVVELDNNIIREPEATPIHPLPEKAAKKLQSGLRKLVPDFAVPISAEHRINKHEVANIFLKFFVKILKKYRDYLEAPSEFVLDKFDKTRFVREHSDSCAFLEEMCETQMFQCFVDDRYGDAAQAQNMEVLFFDEYIDSQKGKQSPFLSDTSHQHKDKNQVVALTPNLAGLPSGKKYQYKAFGRLDHKLFMPVREVPRLVEKDEDMAAHAKTDITKLSMKFFTEKRLYSQHFHSLRLRSSKQDLAFKDMVNYFKEQQLYDEQSTQAFEKMCSSAIDKDLVETNTTLDVAYDLLKSHVSQQCSLEIEAFRQIRRKCCIPMYDVAYASEHQLKILFKEAAGLEEKTGQGKSHVEQCLSRAKTMKKKYRALKEECSGVLSAGDIARLVLAQSEVENASLEADEADTSFRTILAEYEIRMPEIIQAIRTLNSKRISQLKRSLSVLVQARKRSLLEQLSSLERVEQAVEAIDVKKDYDSFTKGTTDFWTIGHLRRSRPSDASLRGKPSISTPPAHLDPITEERSLSRPHRVSSRDVISDDLVHLPAGHRRAISEKPANTSELHRRRDSATTPPLTPTGETRSWVDKREHARQHLSRTTSKDDNFQVEVRVRGMTEQLSKARSAPALLSVALNMWGTDGFDKCVARAGETKKGIKEMTSSLEEWAMIYEWKARKLQLLSRAMPESLEQQHTSLELWKQLVKDTERRGRACTRLCNNFRKLASKLRLTKGELKQSTKRYIDHRSKLEAEVVAACNKVARAHEARVRAQTALEQVEATHRSSVDHAQSQKLLEIHAARIEKANREFKEADHTYILTDRERAAAQEKHDVCMGRLLDLFEEKEKRCATELHTTLNATLQAIQINIVEAGLSSDKALRDKVSAVDPTGDLKEFVLSSYDQNVPMHERMKPDEEVDFGRHLLHGGFDTALRHFGRGISAVKAIVNYMEEAINIQEYEAQALRKLKPKFGVTNCQCASLQEAFTLFNESWTAMLHAHEDELKTSRSVSLRPFIILKAKLKTQLKAFEKEHTDLQKAYEKSINDRDKALTEEKRAKGNLQSAQDKYDKGVAAKEQEENGTAKKKGFFKGWGSSPVEVLKEKLANAKKEYETYLALRVKRDEELQEMGKKKQEGIQEVLRNIQSTEIQRMDEMVFTFTNIVDHHSTLMGKFQKQYESVSAKSATVDIDRDIQLFIHHNRSALNPPVCVFEDFSRRAEVQLTDETPTPKPSNETLAQPRASLEKPSRRRLSETEVVVIQKRASKIASQKAKKLSIVKASRAIRNAEDGSSDDEQKILDRMESWEEAQTGPPASETPAPPPYGPPPLQDEISETRSEDPAAPERASTDSSPGHTPMADPGDTESEPSVSDNRAANDDGPETILEMDGSME